MPLPDSLIAAQKKWHSAIEQHMRSVIAVDSNNHGSLEDMCWYHLNTGGKRLRPLLALMATEALEGDADLALPFATGIELLHNATLVHDDYQDGDEVRRKQPTVWKKYGWEQCINAGDGLFFAGIQLISQSQVTDIALQKLMATTTQRMLQVVRGQVNEYRLKTSQCLNELEYIEVIRGKTAGLFALPLEGAAIISEANPDTISDVAALGDRLGLMFQVQDDLLDLLGDKGRHRRGTDIAEGKPSLPLIHCLENGEKDLTARVLEIIQKPRNETTDAEIDFVIQTFHDTGSIDYGLQAIRNWLEIPRAQNPAFDRMIDDIATAILAPIEDHM